MKINDKTTGDAYEAFEFTPFKNEIQNAILSNGEALDAADSTQLGKSIQTSGMSADFYYSTYDFSAKFYSLTGPTGRLYPNENLEGLKIRFIVDSDNVNTTDKIKIGTLPGVPISKKKLVESTEWPYIPLNFLREGDYVEMQCEYDGKGELYFRIINLRDEIVNGNIIEPKQKARFVAIGSQVNLLDYDSAGPNPTIDTGYFTGVQKNGIACFVFIENTAVSEIMYFTYDVKNRTLLGSGTIYNVSKSCDIRVDKNQDRFILSHYEPASFKSRFFYSQDGLTWTSTFVDDDTSRNGGRCIEVMSNGRIVIPAYDDANNSVYYSNDSGGSWIRSGTPVTSPLHKPFCSASSGRYMIWVDENKSLIKISENGIQWSDCVLSGGTLSNPVNAIWAGDRFVVLTDDYVWVSDPNNQLNFTRYNLPSGIIGREIFYSDGVIGLMVLNQTERVYGTTTEKIINDDWTIIGMALKGNDALTFKQTVAVGDSVVFVGPNVTDAAETSLLVTGTVI